MRVYQLARHLSNRHHVTLLAYAGANRSGEDRAAATWYAAARFVPAPKALRSRRAAQAASMLSSRSFHMNHLRSRAMSRAVTDMLRRDHFDIVQIESSQMAPLIPDAGIPVVLDEHNVEFMLLKRLSAMEASPVRKTFGRLEAFKAGREELRSWAAADGVVFTSQADLAIMRRLAPESRGCVVPNGVDVEHFQPRGEDVESDTVLFTGSINYRPNTDAVDHFMRHIFPAVRRQRPSARFIVVGQGAPEWLVRSAPSGVEFTGPVEDVRPFVARASVVVAPLRSGGGTRLKILEALAMAKPVVSTKIGCEGIAVVDGHHLRVADDHAEFANHVVGLMSDRKVAREMGRHGRTLVECSYSWDVVGRRLEGFYSDLIGKETRV